MSWSIRCADHPLSDSKLALGVVYDDVLEAEEAAREQTEHHRSVGLDCTFIVARTDELPVLTDVDLDVALIHGIKLEEGVDYHYLAEL